MECLAAHPGLLLNELPGAVTELGTRREATHPGGVFALAGGILTPEGPALRENFWGVKGHSLCRRSAERGNILGDMRIAEVPIVGPERLVFRKIW